MQNTHHNNPMEGLTEIYVHIAEAKGLPIPVTDEQEVRTFVTYTLLDQAEAVSEEAIISHCGKDGVCCKYDSERLHNISTEEHELNDVIQKMASTPLIFTIRERVEIAQKDKTGRKNKSMTKTNSTSNKSLSMENIVISEAEGIVIGRVSIDLIELIQGRTQVAGWFPIMIDDEYRTEDEHESNKKSKKAKNNDKHFKLSTPNLTSNEQDQEEPENTITPQIYIVITMEDPLIPAEKLQDCCLVSIDLKSMHLLPSIWLSDASKIEEEEEKERDEANKNKKSKRNVKPKAKTAEKKKTPSNNKTSKKDDNHNNNNNSNNNDIEEIQQLKNLYTVSFELPNDNDNNNDNESSCLFQHTVDKLITPPSKDTNIHHKKQESINNDVDHDEDDNENDTKTRGKSSKKAEHERIQKLKEKAELLEKQELDERLNHRYISFDYSVRRMLLSTSFEEFRQKVLKEESFPIYIERSIVLIDENNNENENNNNENNVIVKKDRLKGTAYISLISLLKPGEMEISGEYSVNMTFTTSSNDDNNDNNNNNYDNEQKNTYIIAKMTLSRPVIKLPEKKQLTITDIIPLSKAPEYKQVNPIDDVHNEITSFITDLSNEYMNIINDSNLNISALPTEEQAQERKDALIYRLNKSGLYHRLKERLKPSLVRYLKNTDINNDNNDNDKYRMLSKLFSKLIYESNKSINNVLNKEYIINQQSLPSSLSSNEDVYEQADKLLVMAYEAELQGLTVIAIERHEERVNLPPSTQLRVRTNKIDGIDYPVYERDPERAEYYYDYGLFCLRSRMLQKGENNIKIAISIDETHCPSLLAYACLLLERDDHEQALIFLRSIYKINKNTKFLYALYAIYYDLIGNEKERFEMWRKEDVAKKRQLYDGRTYRGQEPTPRGVSIASNRTERNNYDDKGMPSISIYVELAQYLIKLRCTVLAERILLEDKKVNINRSSVWGLIEYAELYRYKEDFKRVEEFITEAFQVAADDGQVVRGYCILGHIYYQQNKIKKAQEYYESFLEWEPKHIDPLLLWRLGEIYLSQCEYDKLKTVYLELCIVQPCSSSWLGVGVACLGLNMYSKSLQSLQQANKLDNKNSRVWGYLTLVSLLEQHIEEANYAFKQTLILKMKDANLYRNIASLYLKNGLLDYAETSVLESLSLQDSAQTRILAGDIYYANNMYEAQCEEYQRAYDIAEDIGMQKTASDRLIETLTFFKKEEQLQLHMQNINY